MLSKPAAIWRTSRASLLSLLATTASAPACCVARGTRVRTPNGLVPIEAIGIGDPVLSFDAARQRLVTTHVLARRSAERACVALRTAHSTLVCTPDHPVFLPRAGAYADARLARPGRSLAYVPGTGARARCAPVLHVAAAAQTRRVYDITVDSALHNFVAQDLVVHNKSFSCPADDITIRDVRLDDAQPEHRMLLHLCRNGEDPEPGEAELDIFVQPPQGVDPDALTGVRLAVFLDSDEEHLEFVDGTVPLSVRLQPEQFPGACEEGVTLVVRRVDEALDRAATVEVDVRYSDCSVADHEDVTIDVDP